MARTMRAHSPAFGSHSTFSTPHLGFWDPVQFLVRTERTAVTAAIVMFVGAYKDCDHHDVGSGSLRRRGEMESCFLNKTGWWWRIVLHPDSSSGFGLCLLRPRSSHGVRRGYMEKGGSWKSAERVSLECDLQSWFASQGVSVAGATRAVQLLDASVLLAQPRPSRWNRKGYFGIQERCRYLWYRHAARILGWCDRRRFPDIVTSLLRGHVFPQHAGRDETSREAVKGSIPAGSHAGALAIDNEHHPSGWKSR